MVIFILDIRYIARLWPKGQKRGNMRLKCRPQEMFPSGEMRRNDISPTIGHQSRVSPYTSVVSQSRDDGTRSSWHKNTDSKTFQSVDGSYDYQKNKVPRRVREP